MSRARDLSKLGNPNVIKADENSVGFGTQVAGNPANADSSLISAGIITATVFYGDGSNLEGVASAGLGTAVDDTKDSIGQNIYFTNQELSINENTTVNAPDTSSIAYTQYQQVTVESGSELIIADGDSFIPDVLGIGTALQASTAGAGNGLFGTLYVDNIENVAGRGGPNFPLGITVAGVSTLSGNVSIGGTLTYEDVTNVDSIGVVTARSGVDINAGGLDVTAGGINVGGISTFGGNVKIGSGTPGGKLHIGSIGSGDIVAELTSGSPTFTYRNGSGAWFHAGKHPSQDAFIISDGANTTANERLRIGSAGQIGLGGANYGSSGEVLTSQGASAAPQWASPAGVWVKLFSGTETSGTTHTMTTNGLTNTYYYYKIIFNMNTSSGNGSNFGIDVTRDGGTTWGSGEFGPNKYQITTSGRWGSSNKQADYSKTYGYLEPSTNYEVFTGVIDFAGVHFTNQHHRFHYRGIMANLYGGSCGTVDSGIQYSAEDAGPVTGIRWHSTNAVDYLKWQLLGTTG